MTSTEEVLAQMERAAFAPHRFEIPVGMGSGLHEIRERRCCRCGDEAARSEFDLGSRARTFFCEVCR